MKLISTLLLAAVAPLAHGTVTINIVGGDIFGSSTSTLAPNSTLMLVVADTDQNGFTSTINAGDSAQAGSFLGGSDDLIVFKTDASGDGSEGAFSIAASGLSLTGNWSAGDPVAIYWFPGLTSADTSLAGGSIFNYFDNPVPTGYSPSWVTPADSGSTTLVYLTDSQGGSTPDADGVASLTVVPEPATYAALAGVCFLGLALLRRRR